MKKLSLLVVALMLASPTAFAKRCRENGKFVKCQPSTTPSAAPVAPAPAATSAPAPVATTAPVSKSGVTVTQTTSKKGKVTQRCRDKKTGRFVKCPQ